MSEHTWLCITNEDWSASVDGHWLLYRTFHQSQLQWQLVLVSRHARLDSRSLVTSVHPRRTTRNQEDISTSRRHHLEDSYSCRRHETGCQSQWSHSSTSPELQRNRVRQGWRQNRQSPCNTASFWTRVHRPRRDPTDISVLFFRENASSIAQQTVSTQARGTPDLLENPLTQVLINKPEEDIKHIASDSKDKSVLHCPHCTEVTNHTLRGLVSRSSCVKFSILARVVRVVFCPVTVSFTTRHHSTAQLGKVNSSIPSRSYTASTTASSSFKGAKTRISEIMTNHSTRMD